MSDGFVGLQASSVLPVCCKDDESSVARLPKPFFYTPSSILAENVEALQGALCCT